jgi:aspartate/methionine/tyrosine aminotransferase
MPGVTVPEPEGAFYVFPRIAGLTDSTAFTAELVQQTGVALAPGAAFGPDGEGHVRLCFAATEETLSKALSRLHDFMVQRA